MTSSTDIPYARASFPPLPLKEDRSARDRYERGHTAGYTSGLRKATAEAAERRAEMETEHASVIRHAEARSDRALASLATAVKALDAVVVPTIGETQDLLVAAALELAEAVIGHELSDGEFGARAALKRVLAAPIQAGTCTVRMHPADLSVLNQAELQAAGATFVPDPSLSRGDAVAEYERGILDARIGTAVDRIRETLLGAPA